MSILDWFGNILRKVEHDETIDFIVTSPLTVGGQAQTFPALVSGQNYLSIKAKSLRLPYTRVLTSKYYGVVHAFANLPGNGQEAAEFASASTPEKLAGLDPTNVSNVITIDKQLVGPTPWNGGDLRLQIGLFSVVEKEFAGPFLSTVTALSDKVGVAFVAAAKPYLDVISSAVSALTRQVGSVRLEVGLDKGYTPPTPGHYAIIAAAAGSLQSPTFDLDPADGRLKVNGAYYTDKPYLVFTIEAADQQDRWGEIPELRAAYQKIKDAARKNDQNEAKDAMTGFRLLALTSPDLTGPDADKLVQKIEAWLTKIFGDANTGLAADGSALPDFDALGLYEE